MGSNALPLPQSHTPSKSLLEPNLSEHPCFKPAFRSFVCQACLLLTSVSSLPSHDPCSSLPSTDLFLLHPWLSGCAVAPCGPVGLDVELIARRPQHLLALARRRLSALEYEALSGQEAAAAGDTRLYWALWQMVHMLQRKLASWWQRWQLC